MVDALITLLGHLESPPAPSRTNADILKVFNKGLQVEPIRNIEIVGHGLGAAVGLLTSLALKLETTGAASDAYTARLNETNIRATLFGLPRVGDEVFASWVDEMVKPPVKGKGGFEVIRVASYADAITHLPGPHHSLEHPNLGEVWVGADPRIAYACRDAVGESQECSNSVDVGRATLMDHAGPYAGVTIGAAHCRVSVVGEMYL